MQCAKLGACFKIEHFENSTINTSVVYKKLFYYLLILLIIYL